MQEKPEGLQSSDHDQTKRDSADSIRRREGRRGRINLLNFMLRGKLRGVSGLALILGGISAIAIVILLLVALIAFVVQRSEQSADFVPTVVSTATVMGPLATATPAPLFSPTPGTPTPATTVLPTSTPTVILGIHTGGSVEIAGTGSLGLNFRVGPGLDFATTEVFDEGTKFKVLEGPSVVDGIEWWRLEGENGSVGWAAGEFLQPVDGADEN